jgi:hypothetical protein
MLLGIASAVAAAAQQLELSVDLSVDMRWSGKGSAVAHMSYQVCILHLRCITSCLPLLGQKDSLI